MLEIVDSAPKHIKLLVDSLRDADKQEIEDMGSDPRKALFKSYRQAIYRKTAFVDGNIVAMWGVCGTPLGLIGHPYFLTTQVFETLPVFTIARIYKEELLKIKELFVQLEGLVPNDYSGAIRLLRLNGATIFKPIYFGPTETLFRPFSI